MSTHAITPGLPLRWAPLLALLALTACGGKQDHGSTQAATGGGGSPPATHAMPASGAPAADAHPGATAAGGVTALAGVAFTPPAAWQDLGPSNMRAAQYRLAAADGSGPAAEVNVFYFGPESGGGVDANLTRWINQMVLPGGGDPAAAAQRSTFTADGMAGHVVTLDGTYKSGGGPMMGGEAKLLDGYRLVGVVLEGPQGSLFFKLTGPVATAKAMEAQLMTMVQGARKAG